MSSQDVQSTTSAPSLDDAIREGLSPKEARRMALRAAQAVATMHAREEVHGSLTPRAFLLARGGDISILASDAHQPALYRMRYASPEAARREPLGKGADTFALSLIIRELIEGKPARRATGDELAMEAIDGRVSVPEGLEGELVSLAAMAASPHGENRPTASEFVAALQVESKFKGFSKQDWIIVGAALAAILMLVFMLRESSREQSRSTLQFENARAAFEGLIGGIYPELDRVENIAPLAEAGRRALASMETMLEEERGPRDRLLLAQTLLWNAKAERVQGHAAEAVALFLRAVERSKTLDDPVAASSIMLDAETALGDLAMESREVQQAAQHYQNAINIGRTQMVDNPESRENRIAFARALLGFGNLKMSTGESSADKALSIFGDARAVLAHSSVSANELDRDALEIRVQINRLEANMAFVKRDTELAIQMLRRHVSGAEQLVEMDPGLPRLRQALSQGAGVLAQAEHESGKLESSVESYRKAVEGWRLLRAMEPDEIRWRRQWARSTRQLAGALADVGEWQEAALLHDTSLQDLKVLMSTEQLGLAAGLEIGEQLLEAAEGLHAAGDLKGARGKLTKAKEYIGKVAPSPRAEARWQAAKVHSDVVSSELLLSEGNWEAAEWSALNFIEEIDQLANSGQDQSVRAERARALLVTSAVRAMQGDGTVATAARNRALGIAEELVREDPNYIEGHVLLAKVLFVLGEDSRAAEVLKTLEGKGYRGLELGPVRAATAALRD